MVRHSETLKQRLNQSRPWGLGSRLEVAHCDTPRRLIDSRMIWPHTGQRRSRRSIEHFRIASARILKPIHGADESFPIHMMTSAIFNIQFWRDRVCKRSWLPLTACLLLSSCATVGGLFEKRAQNKVYIGTRIHVDLECIFGSCLDFPLSLAADTAL